MSAQATNYNDGPISVTVPSGGYAAGEVLQLPDGRAGVVAGLAALTEGQTAGLQVQGRVTLAKTASVVILKGGRVFWDRSANTATPLQIAAGADFFIGVAVADAASADTTVEVDLNVRPNYLIDLHEDAFDCVPVGTVTERYQGGEQYFAFTTATEAEKLDLISRKSVPVTVPMIFEAIWQVDTAADADVADVSVGLANATHASDMDSATETALFHQDSGADLNLDAESDDGTHEVAATDTTVDVVAGTDVEVWIDARDLDDLKYYVNGVRVLSSTSFVIHHATGPLKALFHVEKSSNDTAGAYRVRHLAVRVMDIDT
jgi:predicted RecA/RadA family phage recombinase